MQTVALTAITMSLFCGLALKGLKCAGDEHTGYFLFVEGLLVVTVFGSAAWMLMKIIIYLEKARKETIAAKKAVVSWQQAGVRKAWRHIRAICRGEEVGYGAFDVPEMGVQPHTVGYSDEDDLPLQHGAEIHMDMSSQADSESNNLADYGLKERQNVYNTKFDRYTVESGQLDNVEEAAALVTAVWLDLMQTVMSPKGGDALAMMEDAIQQLTASIDAGEVYSATSFALWFENEVYLKHVGSPEVENLSIPVNRRELYAEQFEAYDLDGSRAINNAEEAAGLITALWLELMMAPVTKCGGDHQALMQAAIDDITERLEAGNVFSSRDFALWFEENVFLKYSGAGNGQSGQAEDIEDMLEAIPVARRKIYYKRFRFYDIDGSGVIDKTEANGLLINVWLELMVSPLAKLQRDNNALMQNAIQELMSNIEGGMEYDEDQFAYWFEYHIFLPLTSENPPKLLADPEHSEVDVYPELVDLDTQPVWSHEVRDRASSEVSSDVERNGSIGGALGNHLAVARAAAFDTIPAERQSLYSSRFDFNDLDGSGFIDSAEEATALVTSLWLDLMAGPVANTGGDNQALMQAAIDELIANIEAGEVLSPAAFATWFEHRVYQAHVLEENECLSPIVNL